MDQVASPFVTRKDVDRCHCGPDDFAPADIGAAMMARAGPALALTDMRVLVVEDEFFIAAELKAVLTDAGAEVVGPCRTVSEALPLVNGNISAAVLDIRLSSKTVAPVATRLAEHGVPFVLYTGQLVTDEILAEWPGCKIIQKPTCPERLVAAIASLLR